MGLVAAGAADAENAGFRGARLAFQACGAPFRSVVGPGPARAGVASKSSVALSRCDRDKDTEQRIGARAAWRSPARARSWAWPGPIGTGTGRCLPRPRASARAHSLGAMVANDSGEAREGRVRRGLAAIAGANRVGRGGGFSV